MSRSFRLAAAALVISSFAPAAFSQAGVEQVSVRVHYADLDVTRPQGGVTLLNRIKNAANTVCGSARTRAPLTQIRLTSECRRTAIDSAVRRLDFAMLTLAWSGRQTMGDRFASN
jgi:UrcA family protein